MNQVFECSTHGKLSGREVVLWTSDRPDELWCVHCVNKMLDLFCHRAFEIEEETKPKEK